MDFDSMLGYARYYHALGLAVIPAIHGDKRPAVKWEQYQEHPPEWPQVEDWFKEDGKFNIGCICGKVSGVLDTRLVVLDFDSQEAYEKFFKKHTDLEKRTMVIKTNRGRHVYLRTKEDIKSTKFTETSLDVRSDGNFVVLPPSIHPSGARYEFISNPGIAFFDDVQGIINAKVRKPRPIRGGQFMIQGEYFNLPCIQMLFKFKLPVGARRNRAAKLIALAYSLDNRTMDGFEEVARQFSHFQSEGGDPLHFAEVAGWKRGVEKLQRRWNCGDIISYLRLCGLKEPCSPECPQRVADKKFGKVVRWREPNLRRLVIYG